MTDRTSPRCEWGGAFHVTAWRTACLYGVSHSRTSPMYTDNVTSSLSGTDSTLSEVRVHTIPTSV